MIPVRLASQWRYPTPLLAVLLCAAGCQSPKVTRIELTTFGTDGESQLHYSNFTRASYRLSAGHTLELVLRTERPSSLDPTQTITQIVYVKNFWKPIPGTTYADGSQINARVQYALLTPPTGVRYDGSAFVYYRFDRRTGQLVGTLEEGTLSPRYRMGDAVDPFGPCRFSGTFFASEDPGDVISAIQMLDSQFYQPIETN